MLAPLVLGPSDLDPTATLNGMRRPSGEDLIRFWSSMESVVRPDRDEPLGLDYGAALDAPH